MIVGGCPYKNLSMSRTCKYGLKSYLSAANTLTKGDGDERD